MAEVYTNGMCNIAANWASNAHEGLFSTRNPAFVQPTLVKPDWDWCKGQQYEIHDSNFEEHHLSNSALLRRAWVLQERLLGRRQIFFGKEQVIWQCLRRTSCELWPDMIPRSVGNLEHQQVNRMIPHALKLILSSKDRRSAWKPLLRTWADILSIYSTTSLTQPRDKLVAISGVAKIFQSASGMQYFAGLWDHELAQQLCWSSSPNVFRPKTYRAPSWSWASLDGQVSPARILGDGDRQDLVHFLNINIQPKGLDLAGEIENAQIKLFGVLLPVVSLSYGWEKGEISLLDKSHKMFFIVDVRDEIEVERLFCLPLCSSARVIRGLMVFKSSEENDGRWKRYGIFYVPADSITDTLESSQGQSGPQSFLSDIPRQDITLI
jgi:hypothetical protein